MKTPIKMLVHCLCILSLPVYSAAASAAATAVVGATLNWTSVSISAPGLTLTPDPAGGGKYAHTASLGVSQAAWGGVAVPSSDLEPYSLSFQPTTSPVSIAYGAGNGVHSIIADIDTDTATATLEATAFDQDGDGTDGPFINAYVLQDRRNFVSGSGTMTVSLAYTLSLTTAGVLPFDVADALGIITLSAQQFAYNPTTGSYTFLGNFEDDFSKHIFSSLGETAFAHAGTLSIEVPFASGTDYFVAIQMSAQGISFANSVAIDEPTSVPEPMSIALAVVGLAGLGVSRRKR
jgi:hypothetical protein